MIGFLFNTNVLFWLCIYVLFMVMLASMFFNMNGIAIFYICVILNFFTFCVFTLSYYLPIFAFDKISLIFIWLTALIFLLSFIYIPIGFFYYKLWVCVLLFTEICILLAFSINNFFIFFVLFEMILMPMFFVVILWGSRGRRIHAVLYFFYYTFASSIPLFCGMFVIHYFCSTFDWFLFNGLFLEPELQIIVLLLFFVGFAAKVPTCPVHIWLPEAHVESPTVGSVILASLLLKLGTYGLLRISFLCFEGLYYLRIFVWSLCIFSIYIGVICACRMVDIKKLVAYSSIVHMNFCLMAIFSTSVLANVAVVYSMVAHAFTSAALFFLIGMLYDRIHTRNVLYIAGHELIMLRWFRVFIWFHIMANMGIPLSANFIAEIYVYCVLIGENLLVFFITVFGIFLLTCLYNLFLLYRVLYSRSEYFNIVSSYIRGFCGYKDLNIIEFVICFVLSMLTLCFGLFIQLNYTLS